MPATPPPSRAASPPAHPDRLPAVEAVRWLAMAAAMLRPVLLGAAVAGLLLVPASWADAWSPLPWPIRLAIGTGLGILLITSLFFGLHSAARWNGRLGRIRAAALVEQASMCHDLSPARRPRGWLVAAADLGGTIPGISHTAADQQASHDGVTTMLSIRAKQRGHAVTGKAITRTTINLFQQRLVAPAALLTLAGLSIAISPAVARAGVERLGPGAWREAAGGPATPSFSRWHIELSINESDLHAAQRGAPLNINATVRDTGFGGLIDLLTQEPITPRTVRTNFEIRPAPDERNTTGSPIVLPATRNDREQQFQASAAARIIASLNTDRVQVRAASYTPQLPRITPRNNSPRNNTPRLGATTTQSNAGRPGWWRGVSEWRVVDLEPTPALERLWVRITGADGLLRGLYELDPQRQGQRVPASAGDVVTIEVDASVSLWGMEVELIDRDAAMPEQPVPVDSVFEEIERGSADRVAWRSYRICGHEGSEVGVGVRAIAQRRTPNTTGPNATRGQTSEPSSPFSLLIAQAADWAETATANPPNQPTQSFNDAPANNAEVQESHGIATRETTAAPAAPPTPTPARLTEANPTPSNPTPSNPTPSNTAPGGTPDNRAPSTNATPQAGSEPATPARESQTNNNDNATPQPHTPTPHARPTREPQLGGEPQPGSSNQNPSGQSTRRPNPEADPEADTPAPSPRIGGGDEPELLQSIAMLRRPNLTGSITIDRDEDRLIIVLGLESVSPDDRAIALAYRRFLINEASKPANEHDKPTPPTP